MRQQATPKHMISSMKSPKTNLLMKQSFSNSIIFSFPKLTKPTQGLGVVFVFSFPARAAYFPPPKKSLR